MADVITSTAGFEGLPKTDKLYRIRHSAAHVLAEAVLEIFPEAKLAIGPPIEDGFYYDFLLPRSLTPDDLVDIEARMRKIVEGKHEFKHSWMERDEAAKFFGDRNQDFKKEIISDLPDEELDQGRVSIYTQSKFIDLCRGPHAPDTSRLGAFKLQSVAGAYWRGDEKRPMLQRVYGTAWESQEELDDYLQRIEEAAKRDHRRIGKDLELFTVSELVGPGMILWLPNGARVRSIIEQYLRDLLEKNGYDWAYTPHVGRSKLWETSGHLGFYKDNIFPEMDIEGQDYYVKPMTCPFHIEIYENSKRSYRELPLRIAELGTVYRYERSGVLHGLMRVRGFTQDDAHIFCMLDQVEGEISKLLDLGLGLWKDFGFDQFKFNLSTQPAKSVGTEENWRFAEATLERALKSRGLEFEVDAGGGAFYGPKIDIMVRDAIGRFWQCTTIQFDFNEPQRFGMTYVGSDGAEHQPFMIHRALFGSIERFFGILIEHYAGAFPVWLSPIQALVIPIADRHHEYAEQVQQKLRDAGLRVSVDGRSERMQHKIREAQLKKIPYMLVVGDKEAADGAVAVRLRNGENLGPQALDAFVERALGDVKSKA